MSNTIIRGADTGLGALPTWPDLVPQTRASHTSGGFVIQVARDIRAFSNWPALADCDGLAKAHAFQRRDHLEIWLETIGAGLKVTPRFVSVSAKTGEPVMLLPFGIEKKHGLRFLKFLDGGVADYNAPVLFPAADRLDDSEIDGLWRSVCRALAPFDLASLEKMPEKVEGSKNPLCRLGRERWHISGHYLTLESEDGSCVTRPNQKESRRKLRRLSEHGGVHFRIADESKIGPVFDAFLRQKSRRYMETLGHPGFDVPGQIAYYLTLTKKLRGKGAQLAYLTVGEEVVATAWNLISGRRLYYMMAGYEDGKWRRYSPGWLLLEELVNWSCRNGIGVFDFGIGDEPYKLKWQETELPLWSARLPNSLLGWSWIGVEKSLLGTKKALPKSVIRLLKAWRNRLRPSAVRSISLPPEC
jgi:CelD/BcsL family acetyltransferase involved in cellulose biosynthesis